MRQRPSGGIAFPCPPAWYERARCAVWDSGQDINTPEIEFFARLSLEGHGFVFVPDYLAEYRSHAGSETARGLTLDRLAEYLEPIDVPADVEAVKRACLEQVLAAGVGIRLARGDITGARRLCNSRYYAGGLLSFAQRVTLSLPDPLAVRTHAALGRDRHGSRAESREGPEGAVDLQRGEPARPRSRSARRSPCARRRMRRRLARPRD